MADLMQSAVEWVRDMQAEHLAQTITYTRSGQSTLTFTATVGRQFWRSNQPSNLGPTVSRSDADFIFDPDEINFGSGTVKPQRGDRIAFDGGTYELRAPEGEPVWRKSDPYGVLIRVHTVKVG